MSGWVAGAIAVSGVVGAVASSSAAGKQASAATQAAQTSADAQERMFNKQVELQEPWRQAGTGALNRLSTGLATGGEFNTPFSKTNWQQDPGYAFRVSEGLKALDRTAASRGGLISGAALKAAGRYGQESASQEYQNAFNRYYSERANQLQPLQSLAGVGQSSANTLTNAAGQYGVNMGNTLASGITGAAGANAAGTMGVANSLSNSLGQGINYYQNQNIMNKLFPNQNIATGYGTQSGAIANPSTWNVGSAATTGDYYP